MLLEKSSDFFQSFRALEFSASVGGSGEFQSFNDHARGLKPLRKGPTLFRGNRTVEGSVQDQGGGIVRADPMNRAGHAGKGLFLGRRSPEKSGYGSIGPVDAAPDVSQKEIRRAVGIDDGLDPAGLLSVPQVSLELRHVAAGAKQGGEMSPRGLPPHGDALRVESILVRLGPQPAYGCLGIVNLGREGGVNAEAISDARDGKAPG